MPQTLTPQAIVERSGDRALTQNRDLFSDDAAVTRMAFQVEDAIKGACLTSQIVTGTRLPSRLQLRQPHNPKIELVSWNPSVSTVRQWYRR
jgi:hypothetical protein